MNRLVASYYLGERSTAVAGLVAGLLFLLISIALWRAASTGTIARGASYVLMAFGILQAAAGGGYLVALRAPVNLHVDASMSEAEMKTAELKRMEAVLGGAAYTGTLVLLTAMLGAGLALTLLSRDRPVAVGIGLAMMACGVAGLTFESLSIQKNRTYKETIQTFDPALRAPT